ncbi:MAG: SpoIIIAH-like family protein [Kyrpidia sp.]|nr:SpoIIIAH-like family protein [Kyrpidia sp.]
MKRQSVWLSTMMVLALMVIGYYTVNSENKPLPTASEQSQGSGSTGTSPPSGTLPPLPPSAPGGQGGGTATAESGEGNAPPAPPADTGSTANSWTPANSRGSSGSDFFAEMALKETQRESGTVERLQEVIANPKSSTEEVAQANNQLRQITDMQGKAEQVVDMLKGAGFPQAVILPAGSGDVNFDHVTVYVQASSLSPQQAVNVMGIVHGQMGVPASNITVYWHE